MSQFADQLIASLLQMELYMFTRGDQKVLGLT